MHRPTPGNGSRILQAANFVAPHSGGIRTVLRHLARGYTLAGHDVVTVTPGARHSVVVGEHGTWITLPGMAVPGTGYRVLRLAQVQGLADELAPDVVEVHDRSTLRGMGTWARARGVASMVVSHERLDRLLAQWLPPFAGTRGLADRSNASLAAAFDTVVCTTGWAASEFARLEVENLARIPLGVDLSRFQPGRADAALRHHLTIGNTALLVLASRLSHEKRPDLAVRAVPELLARRVPVSLAVAGDGPLARKLRRSAAGLPVRFLGHLDGDSMTALLATADVVLAPGPVETFGLAALESLASGTAVVANPESALPEVLGPAGRIAESPTPAAFADAVVDLLAEPDAVRQQRSRSRAERFDRDDMVAGFLSAHGLAPLAERVA